MVSAVVLVKSSHGPHALLYHLRAFLVLGSRIRRHVSHFGSAPHGPQIVLLSIHSSLHYGRQDTTPRQPTMNGQKDRKIRTKKIRVPSTKHIPSKHGPKAPSPLPSSLTSFLQPQLPHPLRRLIISQLPLPLCRFPLILLLLLLLLR